jgi:Transglycosylase SLT domain
MVRAIIILLSCLMVGASSANAAKFDRKAFASNVCVAIDKASAESGVDRNFFTRLLWRESLFDPNAVSPKGAQGIAQFMPDTADRRKLDDPFEPLSAVKASASFLADLKKSFGNLGLAAAAYNAGEQRVTDWLAGKRGLPDETQEYVSFITGRLPNDWRVASASFDMPALGKGADFKIQCVALASRNASPPGKGVRLAKLQPWGVVLTQDFDEGRALIMFKRLKLRFPQLLDGKTPMIARQKNLSRGTRKIAVVMIGAGQQAEAQALCSRYTGVGLPCIVRKNR